MQRTKRRQSDARDRDHHSFDVFDTVLTRSVGAPEAVFRVVARRLREQGRLPAELSTFVAVRQQVPDRLIRARGREATLAEIYAEVAEALGLSSDQADAALECELQCERELCRAVPGAVARLASARTVGPVLFISDTPLPGSFVQELLTLTGLWRDGDTVLTSADHAVRKAHGGQLFDVAAAAAGTVPADVHHTGDNAQSDVAEARLRGLRTTHAPAARLNRYEELLEREAEVSDGASSFIAGASRLARLRAVEQGIDPVLAAGAAGVAAPLLVGYAAWLVTQAEQLGLGRLYFVSRDAQVMLQVFRPVAALMGSDVDLRYLYGSRSAWELSSLHLASADDVRDRLLGHRGDSLAEALNRLGLAAADLGGAFDSTGGGPLSDRTLERLATTVGQPPLLDKIRAAATGRRDLMLAYLSQEGLATDGPVSGLVDVGWMGRTFQSLDTVMEQESLPAVHSYFYIGRSVMAPRWSSKSLARRQRAWLFDQVAVSGRPEQPSGIEAAIEALCSGTEGSLRGYSHDDHGQVVPVLTQPHNRSVLEWGLGDLRTTLDLVADELASAPSPLLRHGDLRGAADAVLRELWLHPTEREVELWGSFPTDDGDDHNGMRSLAVQVRTSDVAANLRAGHLKLRPAFSWRAGTASSSPVPWRQVLQAMIWYDRHGSAVRALPHRVRLRLARRG